MYSQLPLNGLRVFEAVARHGSFAVAATELRITASAVSHQMRILEKWMGGKLMERSVKGFRVSPRGALLAQALSPALSEIAVAARRAQAGDESRKLVIAVIPSVAACWLIPKLAGFREMHPNVALSIVYAIHGQSINFDEVDVAIVYGRPEEFPRNVQALAFLSGDSLPVCSTSFWNLHGPVDVGQLSTAPLLLDTDDKSWREWIRITTGKIAFAIDGPVFADFNLLRAATLAGQGISLCPIELIHDDVMAGRLRPLSSTILPMKQAYYLLKSTATSTRGDVVAFEAWLQMEVEIQRNIASHTEESC